MRLQILIFAAALTACGALTGERDAALPIGPNGAGGVSGATKFTLPAIERALPGMTISANFAEIDGAQTPVFEARPADGSRDEPPLFVIEPTWDRGGVGAITTRHPAVEGPNGERVGDTRLSNVRGVDPANCERPGKASQSWTCRSSAAPTLLFVFDADDQALDDAAILTAMRYEPAKPR